MRLGLLLAVGSLSLFVLGANAQEKKHPNHHLHHALWELRDARTELKEAKHDFGGHREKALHAVNDAIKQLDLILLYKGDNVKGVPTRGDLKDVYKGYKHHPHMHHAVVELKEAHHQIKETKHSFDGHKEAATRDIHKAIEQLELALKHPKK